MTSTLRRLIVIFPIFQLVAACSTAPERQIATAPSEVVATEPPILPAPALGPIVPETEALVPVAAERTLVNVPDGRPRLAVHENDVAALLKTLPAGTALSYVVLDLEEGTNIAAHHAERAQIPASSAKLATAVGALEVLGPDHRFRTELRTTGPIADGVLKGDVILVGGGDPVLDIPDLLPLVEALARQGVRRLDGQFLIDDSLLPRFTQIETSQPMEAAYNPGIGALSLAFNRVNLRWNKRTQLAVETVPNLGEARFQPFALNRSSASSVQLKGFDGQNPVWQLADRGAKRSKRSLPVKDAGLHAGRVFADLADLYGIELPAPKRATRQAKSHLLAVHESRPLRELVRDMLWYSNNMVAELIGLAAAKTVRPEVKSLDAAADALLSMLGKELPETSFASARLTNHSGLSSDARLSPAQLAAILRHGWQEGMLSSLLPGSGWSGTLARRFDGPDQALRIWAKTGSMNYVATLGGYLLSSSHSPAAFVIMIADEKARSAYDAAPKRTRDGEKKANAWRDNVEKTMDQIVQHWLDADTPRPPHGLYAQN